MSLTHPHKLYLSSKTEKQLKKVHDLLEKCNPQPKHSILFKFITRMHKPIVYNPTNRLFRGLFQAYVIIISTPGYGFFSGIFQRMYVLFIVTN